MTGTLTIQRPDDAANLVLETSDGTQAGHIEADESLDIITYHGEDRAHKFTSGSAPVCAFFNPGISVTGDITATGSITGDIAHDALNGLGDDDHPQYVLDAGDDMTGTLSIQKPVDAANLIIKKSDGTEFGYIQAEESDDWITYHGADKSHRFEAGSATFCADFEGDVVVNGDLCTTSGLVSTCSDARYKKDVVDLSCALEDVLRLRGVTYRWRRDEFPKKRFDDDIHHGFIAQEIQQILPDAVHEDADGYLSVDYSRVTPLLVEAIKDQQKQIDELRAMIEQQVASN